MRQTKKQTDLATVGMRALRGAMVAVGGAAALYMGTRLVTSIATAGLELERLKRGFGAVSDSSEKAAQELEYVRGVALKNRRDLRNLSKEYLSLTAAARGTNLEGAETREIFEGITQASVALGLSADQTSGALRAIQQMISKGTVSAEELRQQLGERLPGAFQLAAKAQGVTTAALGKMLQNGELMAEELLPKLARALKERFGQAARDASDSAQASFNRFKTALFELQADLADDILPALADAADEIREVFSDPQTVEAIAKFTRGIAGLITVTAKAFAALVEFGQWVGEELGARISGISSDDIIRIEQELLKVEQELEKKRKARKNSIVEVVPEDEKALALRKAALEAQAEAYYRRAEAAEAAARREEKAAERAATAAAAPSPQIDQSGAPGFRARDDVPNLSEERLRAIAEVYRATRTEAEKYEQKLYDLNRQLDEGDISFETYSRAVRQLADDFTATMEKSGDKAEELSEFAVQAARNIQSAFAEFFFDPFENGLDGLVTSFRDALRRMVAELAAQELLIGVARSALGQSIGMGALIEHGGGVVGDFTRTMRTGVSPMHFLGAQRFHRGGEVPAILQQGEEVLTEDDPRHTRNRGAGRNVQVQVINQGTAQEPVGEPAIEETPDGIIVGIVLEDQERNGPITRGFRSVLGSGRGRG